MTQTEAFDATVCPDCGEPVFVVKQSGLVACSGRARFSKCRWFVRVAPLTKKTKKR